MHLQTKVLYNDIPKLSIDRFAAYHLYYREIPWTTECAYNPLLLQQLSQLSSLFDNWSNCIIKFGTYHSYYKDKTIGNPIWTFVYVANYFQFLCYWSNFSATFFLAYNSSTYITELSMGKLSKTSLHLFSNLF